MYFGLTVLIRSKGVFVILNYLRENLGLGRIKPTVTLCRRAYTLPYTYYVDLQPILSPIQATTPLN